MNCDRCKDTGSLTFTHAGVEKARLCPDCDGKSWVPERQHFWQEWRGLDAGAKVLVLGAFCFGIWLIYMFASV